MSWSRFLLNLHTRILIAVGLLAALASMAGAALGSNRQIAFESNRDGNWEIYLLDIDSGIEHNFTRNPAEDRTPTWSSDGQSLAFFSTRNGGIIGDIFVKKMYERNITRITDNSKNNWLPSWSPDGSRIAYVINYGGMYVMDADGTNPLHLGFGFRPTWSPDSRHVVYYANREDDLNSDLYEIDLDNGQVRGLTRNGVNDWDPAWSPDGRYIAFASARKFNAEIYLMEICDNTPCPGTERQLTDNRVADMTPAWSPDSQFIAFTSDRINNRDQIFVMDVNGGGLHQLTSGHANNRLPAWKPH